MALIGILKFLRRIARFAAPAEVQQVVAVESNDIVNAVKLQLARGIDGDGLAVYLIRDGVKHYNYHRYTIWRKDIFGQSLGKETSHITNFMTGRFYDSLFVETYSDGTFQVMSSDPRIGLIKFRSGENLINLSPQSMRFLFEERMAPMIQKELDDLFMSYE